jgi:hypothetical protein
MILGLKKGGRLLLLQPCDDFKRKVVEQRHVPTGGGFGSI